MKKILCLILITVSSVIGFAQTNTFPPSGHVGIGTTNPQSPLNVIGDAHVTNLIGGNGSYFNVLKIPSLDSSPAYFYINTNIPASDYAAPQIQITGYMYGALNRAMKITLGWYHYAGNFYWSQWHSDLGYQKPSRIRLGTYLKNGAPYIRIEISNNNVYWSNYSISATDAGDSSYDFYTGWTYNEGEMPVATTNQIHTVIEYNDVFIEGKVGIGIYPGTDKLAVNGNIRAKEIKVETANWPDYVFAPEYQNTSLTELEKFIKTNKHLPDMPAAKEVEEHGVSLGEMNKALLKKVEELTLHLIEEHHARKRQQKQIKQLSTRLNVLLKKKSAK